MTLPSPLARLLGDAARLASRPLRSALGAGTSAAVATVQTAIYAPSIEGAAFIAAVWAGVAALFHSKAWEEQKKAASQAGVEIAKAQSEHS